VSLLYIKVRHEIKIEKESHLKCIDIHDDHCSFPRQEMVDKQGESMVASYRYLGVSNPGAMSVMFSFSMTPRPHSSISEGFLHSILSGLRRILGSWNLVNPLLSMNEAWMDECAARIQPLSDQYKSPTSPNFCNRKNSEI